MKILLQNCIAVTDKSCVGFLTEGARSDPDIRAIAQNAGLPADKLNALSLPFDEQFPPQIGDRLNW